MNFKLDGYGYNDRFFGGQFTIENDLECNSLINLLSVFNIGDDIKLSIGQTNDLIQKTDYELIDK